MLDPKVFSEKYALILAHFGREVIPENIQGIYETFAEHLTTEEFLRAYKKAIASEFFPSATKMIESVVSSAEDEAIKQFGLIRRMTVHHQTHKGELPLSDIGKIAALETFGTFRQLTQTSIDQIPIIQKMFVKTFLVHAKNASPSEYRSLPEPTITGLLTSMPEYTHDCRWEHFYPKLGRFSRDTGEAQIVWGMINTHPPDPVDERCQKFLEKAKSNPEKLAKLLTAKHLADSDFASYRIQAENFAKAKDGLIAALNQEIQKLLQSQAA